MENFNGHRTSGEAKRPGESGGPQGDSALRGQHQGGNPRVEPDQGPHEKCLTDGADGGTGTAPARSAELPGKIRQAAAYCRLSREDGDRPESDSIGNQRKLLAEYAVQHPELEIREFYVDDGYTGTNFDRPAFRRMLADIERGAVSCVLVKDLSRFGRDYIDAGRYLERWFPEHGARFVAVTDNIDSARGAYDMMMPLKNLFNAQYAKDISQKVKSALRTKQRQGEFIGAFAGYGYRKDPGNHNHLLTDPVAAATVRRIFSLFEGGAGKLRIAKLLNQEQVPCPSEYKRLMGERYRNGRRLEKTACWTYSTIHRILSCELYIGNLEQGRDQRTRVHGPAKRMDKSDWVITPGTHEPIIAREQWDRVQTLLRRTARTPLFGQSVSLFAGFLKCGDCGRAMAKETGGGQTRYVCGSYKRCGPGICTQHSIRQDALEKIVLTDLNRIVASVPNLRALAERVIRDAPGSEGIPTQRKRLNTALTRVRRLKQSTYEDYREQLIAKGDFLRYRADYESQERALERQLAGLKAEEPEEPQATSPWVRELLRLGRLAALDRVTVAETVREIRVFEDGSVEITYRFSEELGPLLADREPAEG